MQSPTPEEVRAARLANGHTQEQAAAVIYKTWRGWINWERGIREMDPALFELYQLKTGQKKL
jgi:putative transcriptional regulator